MALLQEIQVPLLAVNDTTLTVVEVCLAHGGAVKKGDLIMVFETSKTTYDVEAASDGYIQYLCEAGRDYEVNTVVARIYSQAEEVTAAAPLPTGAPSNGVAVGTGMVGGAKKIAGPAPIKDFTSPVQGAASWEGETLFSREAARLMAEAGIAPSVFAGRDLVTGGDVQAFLQPASADRAATSPVSRAETSPGSRGGSSPVATGVPSPATRGVSTAGAILPTDPQKVIVERLSSGKKREIEYLADVQSSGLTSTLHTWVETEGIFVHINRSLKYLKDSLLPVIVYEVSRLLEKFPLLNAYYTGDAIARYKEVNPGFAVDIDKGLKVLKIAGAGRLGIQDIEKEIIDLSGRYLDDALELEQLTDITFTITDLSSEGVILFRPLINKMNSAILGVSAIDGKLQRCMLSITFDHRVTEGKHAAQFLKELKGRLESYRSVDAAAAVQGISCSKCMKTLQEDLAGVGFARCVTPEGKDGYICQSCLKGF